MAERIQGRRDAWNVDRERGFECEFQAGCPAEIALGKGRSRSHLWVVASLLETMVGILARSISLRSVTEGYIVGYLESNGQALRRRELPKIRLSSKSKEQASSPLLPTQIHAKRNLW